MAEKLLIYDCETTGVDSKECAIHQLSGMIVIDGEVKEKFDIKMRPHDGAKISDEALEVSGVTLEQISQYPTQFEGYRQITEILAKHVDKFNKQDKFHLAGYNNRSFDDMFFRAMFERQNDVYFGSWFWSDSIDAMILASGYLRGKRSQMVNFKLSTVAAACGIKVEAEKLHDANYDLELTYRLIKGITMLIDMGAEKWKEIKQQQQNNQ